MRVSPGEIYEMLHAAFGPQHWWPGESPLEVIVGALLTQHTAWRNVARAIENLRAAGVLNARALYELPREELEELIRPAGYFRLKTKRLRNFLKYLFDAHEGDLNRMFGLGLGPLREELLALSGIGPETADAILLYAGNLPTFVVDHYTARVFKRHGWIEPEADYYALQEYFHSALPSNARLFNEYHALLVQLAKEYCKTVPACEHCPLRGALPEGGVPLELK